MDKMLRTELEVRVISPDGEILEPRVDDDDSRGRVYVNTPLSVLYPNTPVVLINWLAGRRGEPSEDDVKMPIKALGTEWVGWHAWGSSIKKGFSAGLPVGEVDALTHLYKKCRDAPRWNRAYLAQGIYGFGYGDITVKVLDCGAIRGGHMVHDGFGLIRRSLAEKLDTGHSKINLGECWDSWQFAQRIPWTAAVAEEVTAALAERTEALCDPGTFAFYNSSFLAESAEWVGAEQELAKHPRIAKSLTRNKSDLLFSHATSIPTHSQTRVAVPARAYTVAEESVVYRYPIDCWANIAVVLACSIKAEMKRVANLEVIQYTLTNENGSAKGLVGVADDSAFEDGVDMYVSTEDFKMYDGEGWARVNRKNARFTLTNAALCFILWYGKGSALGIEPDHWKGMGGDCDGDPVEVFPTSRLPAVAAEIKKFPKQHMPKLVKDNLPIMEKDRILPRMLVRGMMNVVGLATVVAGHSFMMEDRLELAQTMGFRTVRDMDDKLSQYIKIGTDQYKTYLLMEAIGGELKQVYIKGVDRHLAVMQTRVRGKYGCVAPWTIWRRNSLAFDHFIPKVLTQEEIDLWWAEGGVLRDMLKEQIRPMHTGTVGQIARKMLPDMGRILTIHEQVYAWPLSRFAGWAELVPPAIYEVARDLQDWWNGMSQGVNWTDGDSVHAMRGKWEDKVLDKCEELDITRWTMANALWRTAHIERSPRATGASIFSCLKDEVKRIVTDKPGLAQQFVERKTFVGIGLHLNVVEPPSPFSGIGTIIEGQDSTRGKRVVRAMLVGVPGLELKSKENSSLPDDLVMMFDLKKEQPPTGTYELHWEKMGTYSAWKVWLLGPHSERRDPL